MSPAGTIAAFEPYPDRDEAGYEDLYCAAPGVS